MNENNIFEQASRQNLRFPSPQGLITAEDLWDLPLTSTAHRANLDDIARAYSRELKTQGEESFVTKPAEKNKLLVLAFEIVKRVIEVRLAENKAARDAVVLAAKKQKILGLIVKKQDEELGEQSIEELEAQLDELVT